MNTLFEASPPFLERTKRSSARTVLSNVQVEIQNSNVLSVLLCTVRAKSPAT